MRLSLRHIIPMFAVIILTACSGDAEMKDAGQGAFTFGITTDGMNIEVVTRTAHQLTANEAADYNITLNQGDETIWSKRYADIIDADRTQPLGSGYTVSAENCSTDEAENANEGWGQRRFAGKSDPFVIVSKETTLVMVNCSMYNAGLCVLFDKSFTDYFSEYAVTTDDLRALKFNATNGAEFDAEHQMISGSVAYYNTDDSGLHSVRVVISASAGWDGTVRLARDLTLQRGKITRLRVRLSNAPMGSISSISITYSDVFDESEEEIPLKD